MLVNLIQTYLIYIILFSLHLGYSQKPHWLCTVFCCGLCVVSIYSATFSPLQYNSKFFGCSLDYQCIQPCAFFGVHLAAFLFVFRYFYFSFTVWQNKDGHVMMIMYIVLVLFIEILLLIVNLLMNQPVCLSVIHSAELSVYLSVSLPVYWSVCLRQSVSQSVICVSLGHNH